MVDFEKLNSKDEILLEYNMGSDRKALAVTIVCLFCLVASLVVITFGPIKIFVFEVYKSIGHGIFPSIITSPGEIIDRLVWTVRLPRFLLAILVGIGLAVSGAVMQPVLKNPMASPFTLGISSGAGFGAAIAIVLGKGIVSGSYLVVGNAFVFAVLTTIFVLLLSRNASVAPTSVVLAGIAFSFLFNALTALLKYVADPWALSEIVTWLMGTLSRGNWDTVAIMFPIIAFSVLGIFYYSWDLNVICLGDDTAKSLGINVVRTRIILMVFASLITSTIVCFTGTIGFVGLVAPHIARMSIGGDNRFVLPASAFIGGLLLVIADAVSVNVFVPIIIPIGIVTSLIGTPIFLHLIFKRQRGI